MLSLEALGLAGLLVAVLVLPFSLRHVEEELELFLLLMGALAVSVSGQWSAGLLGQALSEPLPLVAAVLGAGAAFQGLRGRWRGAVRGGWKRWGAAAFQGGLVLGLALASAAITSLVAALLLAEALEALGLPRRDEVRLAVLACFAVGLGSALTPLGGPLAAIALSRVAGGPLQGDPWLLARALGPLAAALLALLTAAAAWLGREAALGQEEAATADGGLGALALRGLRVYAFVVGLVWLGQGFAPLAERLLPALPSWALYWANSASALLDNATLVAAELGPKVGLERLRWLMMGLLISGGMLIPGNIPNILCASRRRIRPRDWARVGIPWGLGLMLLGHLALWWWGNP